MTGKFIFPSAKTAKDVMLSFKSRMSVTDRINGKRVKRRIGKPDQTRAYYCPHCHGFHLTSMKDYKPLHARKKQYKDSDKNRSSFIKTQNEIDKWKEDSLPFPETD